MHLPRAIHAPTRCDPSAIWVHPCIHPVIHAPTLICASNLHSLPCIRPSWRWYPSLHPHPHIHTSTRPGGVAHPLMPTHSSTHPLTHPPFSHSPRWWPMCWGGQYSCRPQCRSALVSRCGVLSARAEGPGVVPCAQLAFDTPCDVPSWPFPCAQLALAMCPAGPCHVPSWPLPCAQLALDTPCLPCLTCSQMVCG